MRTTPVKVCCPGGDTLMLTEAALMESPCDALDMGTGSGHMAIELAKRGFRVEASDICPDAVAAAQENAKLQNCSIRFFLSDLWRDAGKYDLVVFNPPIAGGRASVKGFFRRMPLSEFFGALLYMVNGDFRRSIMKRFVAESAGHLNPGGRLMFTSVSAEMWHSREIAAANDFDLTVVRKKGLYSAVKLTKR